MSALNLRPLISRMHSPIRFECQPFTVRDPKLDAPVIWHVEAYTNSDDFHFVRPHSMPDFVFSNIQRWIAQYVQKRTGMYEMHVRLSPCSGMFGIGSPL